MKRQVAELTEKQKQEALESFNYWMFDMDDVLQRFRDALPPQTRDKLDCSPASLDVLEGWLLERYPDIAATREPSEAQTLDGAGRYIGETFQRQIGGVWDLQIGNPKGAYFKLPVLTDFDDQASDISPLSLATASTDRRTGDFLRTVLENYMGDQDGRKLS